MYSFRKLTAQQQKEVLEQRRICGIPLHQTPRLESLTGSYLITAANFEHQHIMDSQARREEWENKILTLFDSNGEWQLLGWCILPNHYHLVTQVDLEIFAAKIGRLHNGVSTQWNREDHRPGRQVWFRFAERGIRSERHLRVALNYVHFNAVKHGYVSDARQWPTCSVHEYLAQYGTEILKENWKEYPVRDFGKGWDW